MLNGELLSFAIIGLNPLEDFLKTRVVFDRLTINDALGAIDVASVTIEPIHAWLHRLLDDELLEKNLAAAPLLYHIGNHHILVIVDTSLGSPSLSNEL